MWHGSCGPAPGSTSRTWGRPATPPLRAAFLGLQLLDGFEGTRDHAAERLPGLIAEAGFADVRRRGRLRKVWGTLERLEATAPAAGGAPGP
jgi:hypothetical protein